ATVFFFFFYYYLYNGSIIKEPADQWLAQKAENYDVYLAYTGHCLLAVQGPKSRDILKNHIDIEGMKYFDVKEAAFNNIPLIVGRLGYSGEIGYELYCHYEQVGSLWDGLLDIGKDQGLGPYGLEATEILSIEKGYLTPTDFYEGSTPLELGLGWTVSFDKDDFFGKQALMKRKEQGLKTKLIGFEVKDEDLTLESGLPLYKGDEKVGEVTQCGPGLTVGKHFLARAWVNIDVAKEGEEIEVAKDGSRTSVTVTLEKDWYDPGGKKIKG
ncbi:MAG: aminomethyltransferase family protein, partial [Desulfobacterales bacterium]|nr:aminomethyltransferase family protein [Desulfobacterales bacterium]